MTIVKLEVQLKVTFLEGWEKMKTKQYFERTATSIAALGKDELKRRIKNFNGRFKLDFSEDYLSNLTVDRLRHILLAAMINAKPQN